MKSLIKAVECLSFFRPATEAHATMSTVKKLYKRAALLVHSDRVIEVNCPYSMTDVNAAWEIISKSDETEVLRLFNSHIRKESPVTEHWKNDPLHKANVPSFYTVDKLCEKEWKFAKADDEDFRWFSSWNTTFIDGSGCYFRCKYWPGSECMSLADITNAFLHRKVCVSYRILFLTGLNPNGSRADSCTAFYQMVRELVGSSTPKAVFEWLGTLEMVELDRFSGKGARFEFGNVRITIYRDEENSSKVFSPFCIDRVKPLTELPKKWTVVHLRKALANGQFVRLKQNYYLTDDYAADAASNSREGYIQNPIAMFEKVLTDDLHLYERSRDGVVELSFGCHMNDGRSIIINLDNRYPLVDMEQEEMLYLSGDINFSLIEAA